MAKGIDYAWQHPSIAALQASGITFACRYLSRDPSKNLTAAEATRLHEAGIATVSNWEASSGAAKLGYNQGRQDAIEAAMQHSAAGGPPDRPIYFSVDFDVPDYATGSTDPTAKLGPIGDYFRGVASAIGVARTGAYGGYWAIKRLLDAQLITWAWQTYGWSGGQWDSRAHIRQVQNGVLVGGADSDIDQNLVSDFGQWGVGMEQGDKVAGNLSRGNKIGDVFADLSNFRDWWYGKPDQPGNNPPPAGSRADLLLKALTQPTTVTVTLDAADVSAIAAQIIATFGGDLTAIRAAVDVQLSDAERAALPPGQ